MAKKAKNQCYIRNIFVKNMTKFMHKIDIKKELKSLYKPSDKKVVEISVPTINFFKIDGKGDLNIGNGCSREMENKNPATY